MKYLQSQTVQEIINNDGISIQALLDEIEREVVDAVMLRCRFNQSKAAIVMNVSRGTMRKKLKTLFGDKYIK